MFERRWIIEDNFGRRWRLWIAEAGEGGGMSPNGTKIAIDGLISFSLRHTPDPYNRVAEVLFEIHNEITGDSLSHREWVQSDLTSAGYLSRQVEEVLELASYNRWLLIEAAPHPNYFQVLEDEPAPDTTPQPIVDEAATWFEVRVLDEVGDPVDGIDVAFGVGGSRRVVPTDGRGVARLEDASTGFVSASVASVTQLREKLAPRWTKPRIAKLPTGPDVLSAELDKATQSLSLESQKQTTLAITPLFRCNELSGVHFAFGRSFLLESALDTLSIMAAAILEDENRRAMIFGHTDTSGAEALNKELSERRALVILTVLTHDTAAWEQLWTGSDDGPHFKEQWGVKEAQHLLNALGVTDDEGKALLENGVEGRSTHAALRRFQRGEYDGARAERGPIPETGKADKATRKEFLLSFAAEVTTDPVPKERFAPIGSAPFMGCGEYNPLSDHARDAASRRTVLFIFDRAAQPQNLPCKLRSLGPCKSAGGVDDPLPIPLPDDKPYRCSIYREIAKTCPCVESEELMHLEVQLHDSNFEPAPETHYELVLDGARVFGTTDSDGIMHAAVRKADVALRVTYQPASEPEAVTIDAVILLPDEGESDRAFTQKIRNLGFGAQGDSDAFAILKFQGAHKKLKRTGKLDDDTKQAVRDLDDQKLRRAFEDEGK